MSIFHIVILIIVGLSIFINLLAFIMEKVYKGKIIKDCEQTKEH